MLKRTIEHPILRDKVTFIRTAIETSGQFSEQLVELMPGGGTPLHHHTSYSETFTALEGELGLELASGRKVFLQPGQARLVNIGEVHRFFNASPQVVRFRNILQPGHEGFENSIRMLYGLAQDGFCNKKGLPKDIRHLALFAKWGDTRLAGWMSVSYPLLQIAAALASRQGIEAKLLETYCR